MPEGMEDQNGGNNQQAGNQQQQQAGQEDEGLELEAEDIIEVIDMDNNGGDLAQEMGEMELENFDEEDEGIEGASGGSPPRDDAKVVFSKHSGSVFCADVDQSGTYAVTGGEDDKAYVWQVSDANTLFECTGHQDSVTCVAFSHDGTYVATADMSGVIKVWKVQTKQQIWGFECSDLEWIEWHPGAPVLMAGTVDGDMWMWKIPSGDCKTFQTPGCTCNLAKVMPDGKRACAGYQNGIVKVWDLKTQEALQTVSGHTAHTDSITSLDCHPDDTMVMTGSTDVTAKLINTTTGKVLTTFNCASDAQGEGGEDSVEAVGFCKTQALAATGTLGGVLTLWDVPTQVARQQCVHQAGIVRLKWADSSPLVFTGTLDGVVHLWDGRSGKSERQWYGHTQEILDLALSKDSRTVLTASGDNTARVFQVPS